MVRANLDAALSAITMRSEPVGDPGRESRSGHDDSRTIRGRFPTINPEEVYYPGDLTSASPEDLRAALTTLPVIEQAKGALMLSHGLAPDAAFALLRWHSQQRNIKLHDLAAAIARTLTATAPEPAIRQRMDHLLDDASGPEPPSCPP